MNRKSFLGSWCPRDAKKNESEEERLFVKNGSWLLEEQIKSCDRKHTPIRIFSAKELERATNNYKNMFHEETPYNLYKGTYEQDREISVKKFKEGIMEIEQIVNEIVIASQMSYHNNVVKFLGCCLETRFPMLVYEFVGISTLSDHICKNKEENLPTKEMLPWEKKLMITIDIANVLTYLHTSGSKPIIHRGIKSYNIFVDRHYVAKLPGFTFSLRIPLGETHVVAPVVGTWGYIDPDCISGRFTEKSDVYSFGAVLLEVLTGNYAAEIEREVSNMMGLSRSGHNSTSMGHPDLPKHLFIERYLNSNVLEEGNIEQSMACVEIALRCLRENPEERPTMMEVAKELRRISKRDAKKNESKEERLFVKNGSQLLEEQIKSCDRKHTPIRIFSAKELESATNNYEKMFHKEGPYNLYKGTYEQDREISVKKFNEGIIEIEQIINEIIIASQMSYHNNVVKFLGCCLETRIPMLVYEFVGISTLSDHICKSKEENLPTKEMLPWEKKLMITIDIANVLKYLHTSGSKPIIHRGIKSYNIFMDRHYVAKLPGFTFSLTVPLGETHVIAPVVGTRGYIDPDCISGRFTEKSDVYSFGAVLLEVLTGNYAVEIEREVSSMMMGSGQPDLPRPWFIEQYLEANILQEGNIEQSMACVEIALRCLRENPEERPTMMEVAQELRRISKILPL